MTSRSVLRRFLPFLGGALGIYFCLLILLTLFQRKLIYFPARANEGTLLESARQQGVAPWRDKSGRLIGWRTARKALSQLHPPAPARARMLLFHGNAGFALHRTYYLDGFGALKDPLWELFLFEYPGYGARPGPPREDLILEAAREAVLELSGEGEPPLYLAGESIGSSVASRLAAEYPGKIRGLFLVTPFLSMEEVAAAHYRFFPVRPILRERYQVYDHLRQFQGPVAFLVAGRDEIVPPSHGRLLFERYAGRKQIWNQEQAGHNTLEFSPSEPWWREVSDFLRAAEGDGRDGRGPL